jgi:thiosulfate dehydrogenase
MRIRAKFLLALGCTALVIAAAGFGASPIFGQDEIEGDVIRGGRLYQAWDRVLEVSLPEHDQAIWKEVAPEIDYDPHSWRCVFCHGWDYRGSDGINTRAVVKRSGFPGLFDMVAESEQVITGWINGGKNAGHDFSAYFSEQDYKDLSAFLSAGLIAPDLIADLDTRLVPGTLSTGEEIYGEMCLSCHGVDGEKINFGTAVDPQYLADITLQNPWRVSHVIRFGHLKTYVPAGEVVNISFSQQIDLLSYSQSLPQADVIGSEEYPVIEYDSQASTDVLAYGAISLVVLVLGGTIFVLKKNRDQQQP